MSTLLRGCAIADGRSAQLQLAQSILIDSGHIVWIRPSDSEEEARDAEVVDAAGTTAIAGMVDCHSHVTLPGGARWLEHNSDDREELLRVSDANARLLTHSGVRWARDVGAPLVDDGEGRRRAMSLEVRQRWEQHGDHPHIRAAGTWLTRSGTFPEALEATCVAVESAEALRAAALQQLDDGADLVKLYMDGPSGSASPWTETELRSVIDACHARGARVTAHSTFVEGTRNVVAAGVDCIEHGFGIDDSVAAMMVDRGTKVVATLAIFRSWRSFGATTTIERFTGDAGRERLRAREEEALVSIATAHRHGVPIAAGTDFGGGSLRANQLPWEVESLVACGLQPWEALAAATWRGGEVLGEPDAGVIREGGPADIVLVHGDPLSDPTALWRVWRCTWW